MKYLRIAFKALGCLLVLVLLLAAALYAWAVIANWHDDPLSEDAERALQYTPPTSAQLQDNGYLIIAGLDAAVDGNSANAVQAAESLGRQRLQRDMERRDWVIAHPTTTEGMPASIEGSLKYTEVLPDALRCPKDEADCITWYAQHRSAIEPQIANNQALLQRLQAAVNAPQFANYTPYNLYTELPRYALVMRGQELWLAQAALDWTNDQQARALQTVAMVAQLRQKIADSSNTLVATMIALAMQYRELRWLSNAVQHTTPQTPPAITAHLDQLLAPSMPNLRAALEGEKQIMAGVFQSMRKDLPSEVFSNDWMDPPGWWERLQAKLTNTAYLPQATLNSAVRNMQTVQQLSDLPATSLDSQYNVYLERQQEQYQCGAFWRRMRNALGNCLFAMASPSYLAYMQRITDVDGYRRLVVLQRQAMAEQVAAADMAQWLDKTPQALRNPYSLQPMQWDAASNSLVMEGQSAQPQNPDNSRTYRVRLFNTQP